jgi:hypothetical protein
MTRVLRATIREIKFGKKEEKSDLDYCYWMQNVGIENGFLWKCRRNK